MQDKLFDSEAKIMDIIWQNEPISAKEISLIAAKTIGWNKNTTYTVIKKLEAKSFIKPVGWKIESKSGRIPPVKFLSWAGSFFKKIFGGSRKALFSALLEDEPLSADEIDELRRLIDNR